MFVSPAVGFCALAAIIRGLRGDTHMGNFYLDMWRVVVYVFLPASLLMGVLLMAAGVPMTFDGDAEVDDARSRGDGQGRRRQAKPQAIARGPVAAIVADQAPRHQRRRLLRRQLGPPVREPQRLDQLPRRASAS